MNFLILISQIDFFHRVIYLAQETTYKRKISLLTIQLLLNLSQKVEMKSLTILKGETQLSYSSQELFQKEINRIMIIKIVKGNNLQIEHHKGELNQFLKEESQNQA